MREKYSIQELEQIYAVPHKHDLWEDHVNRVKKTIQFARKLGFVGRVADLSCGDGAIARALSQNPILGDFAPGYPLVGPIEATIWQIPFIDVFVCCETLEHLDDPLSVLKKIRGKARRLLLSTPVHDPGGLDENEQHYWVYDREGVEDWLVRAQFNPIAYQEIYNGIGYRYGVWACK